MSLAAQVLHKYIEIITILILISPLVKALVAQ